MNNKDPKNKKTVAKSYDDKFGPSTPDEISNLSRAQARKNIEEIEKVHGSGKILESFNLSANKDYLEGWENPHSIYGGLNTQSIDPFEELRAINQPWSHKALSGAVRVSTKIISEVAKIPGYIGGLGGGIYGEISDSITGKNEYSFTEQAFNNGWVKAVEQINQNINEEALPVYVKKAVKEGNLWDNITSIDFWATEGADGIGFMASMLVPGAILKSLGLGSKMMNATSKLASWSGKSQQLAKVARGVEKLGLNAQKFDVFNATVANTYLEAAAESGMAMESFEKEHKESFILEQVQMGKTMEQAEQEFNTQKAILGRDMFMGNAMLLLGPNALQSAIMFGKPASKFLSSYSFKDASKSALKRVAQNTVSEGLIEEAGQSTMEHYFKDKASKNQLKGDGFLSLEDFDPKGLKDAYLNTISSVDGQKAIFLGAVLGSTMSIYQGRKEDIANKKASDRATSLTQRYDETLRALHETDVYKKDADGNIIYDYNNKPIVDKKALIEKFRTLDALSERFDEYDKALQEGNEETLEKVRNKTIQDVVLPFIKEGEVGIEALSNYYDKMLESEEVQTSENFEDIKKRKAEVLKIAEEVSKKYENYVNFATNKFDINIKVDNKEQLKALNAKKREYFNKLASSYALAEIERDQVKNKLDQVNKEIEYLEKINKVDEITVNELIKADRSIDFEKEYATSKRNELESKNVTYKQLKERKQRLEDKFKKVEDEIAKKYFNNKKIQKNFELQNKENVVTEKPQITQEISNEENLENEVTTEDLNIFQEPEITEEDKIEEALEVNDTDELIKDIRSQMQNQEIVTKEDLNNSINELPVEDNLKESIKLILTDEYNSLPTQEEINAENKVVQTELEGINEEELKESDVAENLPVEEVYNEDVTSEDITLNENSKIKGHILMSLNKMFKPVFDVLKDFVNYEKEPRNKKDDEVSFGLGDLNYVNEPTIKPILEKVKSNKKLTKSELEFLEKHREYLENNLPIEVTLSNGKKSAKSFLTALGNRTGVSKDIFIKEELPLRKNIIEQLFKNNFNFSKFKGSVKYQGKGKLNLDNINTQNNVLELSIFKDMSEDQKIKYIQENSYYVNINRELISTLTGQPTSESFNHVLKALHAGDIFLVVTRPNGEKFPLKLNNNKLSRDKANTVVKVLSLWSNLVKDNLSINGKLETFLQENLGEDIKHLESELKIIKDLKGSNIEKLKILLDYIIHTQNNNEVSKFYLDNKGNLVLGTLVQKVNEQLKDENDPTFHLNFTPEFGFTGFNYTTLEELYKDDLTPNQIAAKEHLIQFLINKKFNIKADFNNKNYVKHVLGLNGNEALVSTNVDVTKDMFEGYSNIFLSNEVTEIEDVVLPIPEKELEKVVVPSQPSFQGYPAPESNEVTLEDILALEIENNSEKIRNYQKNSVSLQEDKTGEIISNGINMDELSDSQKKEFNKQALKMVDKSVVQQILSLKSIDDIFNKLKSELSQGDLNKLLNTVCKK